MRGKPRLIASELLDPMPADLGPRIETGHGVVIHVASAAGSVRLGQIGDYVDVLLSETKSLEAVIGEAPVTEHNLLPGTLLLSPAKTEAIARWSSWRESILIGLRHRRLQQLALAEFGQAHVELQAPTLRHVDETALSYARLLSQEVDSGEPVAEVYVDALLTAFGIHLLRNYSVTSEASRPVVRSRLSPSIERRIDEFLRSNLARRLSVSELASLADLSPGRFTHAFRQSFGSAPYQYVLELRIAEAERLLTATDLPLSDIATTCGFSSQSHLTNTMMRQRGTTPGEIRRAKRG
jgi:AraC family transcriptional regulator